ncbi:MAG: precorrin-8X methylmutase [Pseudomonadota bacterium]
MGPVSVVRSDVLTYERDPTRITQKSFETIRAETDLVRFGGEAGIAERMIHAAGDTGIVGDIVIQGSLSEAVGSALAEGACVVVDSEMTRHAILRRAVAPERIVSALNTTATAEAAHAAGTTRSALAIRHASTSVDGGVVVVGNAPTALFELIALMRKGVSPRAIVAAPVGFIGAAESKAALIAFAPMAPFVTLKGRRGGSAIAGAAFNAATLGRGA